MEKPEHHIIVCCGFRTTGSPQGFCHKKGAINLLGYLENEINDRGLEGVQVTSSGCLKACDRGPVMVIHPENVWYGKVESEDAIDQILDAMEAGSVVEDLVLS
ncbi:(2Fe-2S) ferredoxin domain-containing protein [Holophaga foetida]|uniref:(2Fe-2S) ferredoxin domain-containing protein n=1 Tax=Holophaga foetida TaxID=35839 RepID=UPI0002473314|nr:(2Fe-2S) ferredoxin domain-containing protein [Holophaga foetida]